MKLYRFVHKQELKHLKNNEIEKLGKHFSVNDCYSNSHFYHEEKKYLHFFYNKKACQNIIDMYLPHVKIDKNNVIKDYYICTFDIPIIRLPFRTARGYYYDREHRSHGYDGDNIKARVELALETDKFDTSWLIEVEPAVYEPPKNKDTQYKINYELEKS